MQIRTPININGVLQCSSQISKRGGAIIIGYRAPSLHTPLYIHVYTLRRANLHTIHDIYRVYYIGVQAYYTVDVSSSDQADDAEKNDHILNTITEARWRGVSGEYFRRAERRMRITQYINEKMCHQSFQTSGYHPNKNKKYFSILYVLNIVIQVEKHTCNMLYQKSQKINSLLLIIISIFENQTIIWNN